MVEEFKSNIMLEKSEGNSENIKKIDFFPRIQGESEEEYQNRLEHSANLDDVITLIDKLQTEENIEIKKDLNFEEQFMLANLFKRIGEDRFNSWVHTMVHEKGKNGLKLLALVERKWDENIIWAKTWIEQNPEFSSKVAIKKYWELQKIKDKSYELIKETLLSSELSRETLQNIENYFLAQTKKMLRDIYAEGKRRDMSVDEVEKRLELFCNKIILLVILLKTAKEQGLKLTPEMIRGMKMESHNVGELAGEKKAEFREKFEEPVMVMMRKCYAKIFEDNPEAQKKVEENFRGRFENLEKYRAYVLTFEFDGVEEAVAFSMIDPASKDCEEGEVMSESTVVHPDAQKGSLGIAFLKKIFETEFEKYAVKVICGKVRAGHPAGGSYDAIGLKKDDSRPNFEEKGVEYEWRVAKSPG